MTLTLDRPAYDCPASTLPRPVGAGRGSRWSPAATRRVRQPRPRGQRAGPGGRSPRTSRSPAAAVERAPRRGLPLAGQHRAAGAGPRVRRRVRRGPRRRRRRVHPQHHGRAEPAGHRRARGPCCASTSSTTRTCCRGGRAADARTGRCPRRAPSRRPSPRSRPHCAPPRRRCSPSPGRPTSPARCCRWRGSPRSRTRRAPRVAVDAAQLAPHRRVDLAATGRRLRRAVRAQALRALRRRGADRAPRLARRRRSVPGGRRRRHAGRPGRRDAGRPRRTGTRRAPRTCSASPRSRRPAGRWRRCSDGRRARSTSARCSTGSPPAWRRSPA